MWLSMETHVFPQDNMGVCGWQHHVIYELHCMPDRIRLLVERGTTELLRSLFTKMH